MAVCWGWGQQTQEAPARWEQGCVVGREEVRGLHFLWLSLLSALPLPLAQSLELAARCSSVTNTGNLNHCTSSLEVSTSPTLGNLHWQGQ